jgi:hypothetical protein
MSLHQETCLEEATSAPSRKLEDRKSNGMIRWFAKSPLNKTEKLRETSDKIRSGAMRRRQTSKVTLDDQSEKKIRIAELERQLAESQERVQQLEAVAAQKPHDKLLAVADESNGDIFEASKSPRRDDSMLVMADTTEPTVNDATKAVPVTPDVPKNDPSPSVDKKNDNQEDDIHMSSGHGGETDLSLAKSDDEESLDQEPDPETNISKWHGIKLESALCAALIPPDTEYQLRSPRMIPPSEITLICEPESSSEVDEVDELDFKIKLEDAQLRARAYRCKLEVAEDLIASLFRDVEKARQSLHSLVSRNVKLAGVIKRMRLEQEEHYISRKSLMKICVYISPVYILFGGLQYFLSTIILVWVLLDLEIWTGDHAKDNDRDQRKKKSHRYSKKIPHHHSKKPEEKIMEPPIPSALHVYTNGSF